MTKLIVLAIVAIVFTSCGKSNMEANFDKVNKERQTEKIRALIKSASTDVKVAMSN